MGKEYHEERAAANPEKFDYLELAPLQLKVTILPRFARRLRCLAVEQERDPEALAARLLAEAIIPDPAERRRLVERDLADAGIGL